MASTDPRRQTKTSLYIATRHRETWTRFCNAVLPTDRSHIVLVAVKEWLDRKDGLEVTPSFIRQVIREELARALRNVATSAQKEPEQLPDDASFDEMADDILSGINFG